ncbi:TPA: guanylate kinase [Clostridioides difficile]|uniref:guanylate kinase n=1 Tax=Clostridioides difficile TaxID=1496 RepID=UPI00038DAEE4|nr:guanylate kinase [Clostridioides difficile]EGT3659665.1 guanylate kinase [Clostridioides difficile]EGT5488455.1 guanylate kinase [Clostridioides difficile]EQG38375.1 guanylate kinase family protein [Clostridioides difficile DA00129]MBH7260339.1 guanylate kinase [Clostridioides difficile]MCL6820392.1 guanylate kinase [Clostridioides difficile]
MNKIFVFLGYSGSGKDSIVTEISKQFNIPILISHTTRPPRGQSEIINKTYHFVDNKFFKKEKNNFIEMRKYIVHDGGTWLYGIHKSELENKRYALAIVDASGYKALEKYFIGTKTKLIPFFINTDENILRKRLINRGDNPKEIERRLKDDKLKFKDFLNNENYIAIPNNTNLINAVEQVKIHMKEGIKWY